MTDYDPQDRPIYPVGSYAEQIVDWLDSNQDYEHVIIAIIYTILGAGLCWLSLGWVY